MELFYRQYTSTAAGKAPAAGEAPAAGKEPAPPLLVLHGLFGAHGNWGWHCKRLAEPRGDGQTGGRQRAIYGVDLRNHGRSPHADDMSYPAMAGDVAALMDKLKLPRCALLGHSMGGKVAMQLALQQPERVERVIVVDIAPVDYPSKGNEEHLQMIDAMQSLDLSSLTGRGDAEEILAAVIKDEPTRKFMVTNLLRDSKDDEDGEGPGSGEPGGFRWRLNLAAIRAAYDALRVKPEMQGGPFSGPVLFVRGAESKYIHPRNEAEMSAMFPQSRIETIADAGHWVHAEQPQALLKVLVAFLDAAD